MLAKRIIPCLDVKDGRVVKGINFIALRDTGDPVENAKTYEEQGADELVFLDITASWEHRKIIREVVEKTAGQVFMPLTVGGGTRNLEDIRFLLKAGADKVSINTAAVKDPSFVVRAAEKFGSQCIVVAIDAKRVRKTDELNSNISSWEVYIYGGRKATGIDALSWAKRMEASGTGEILLTSMDRDGTKRGYDIELTKTFCDALSIPVIASGGAGNMEHILEVFTLAKAQAALAASIFHYQEYSIPQVKEYLKKKGVNVRI